LGVLGEDKFDFLGARPSLDLFLKGDHFQCGRESFNEDQFIEVVLAGEAVRVNVILVFAESLLEVGCGTDVEILGAIGEDVNAVFLHLEVEFGWSFDFAQDDGSEKDDRSMNDGTTTADAAKDGIPRTF
jgi:hypothetical protein